ncbi:MAG: glycosyl transferase group 1 [Fibrobacteres bacterium]|nr:glycosyl transferase group 1 [Fibrobacterota bacterium]
METSQKAEPGTGEITLVVAQSPRYYPHVERHLKSLKKAFARVRLLYWEKDGNEPVYSFPGVETERLVLPFGSGGTVFFLRLMAGFFFRLRRMRPQSIEAIDPYALAPARLYSFLAGGRRIRIAYFSMEYFSELPSLRAKPWKRRIWRGLERWGAGGSAVAATVCDSIAAHLRADFKIPVVTVRNVPERSAVIPPAAGNGPDALHARCGLPAEAPILIYQGMLQEGRGLETALRALPSAPGIHFAVIGDGPLRESLRALAKAEGCADRTHFLGEVDFRDLVTLTRGAFAGLAPFQALSASYLYSLPGKLFEYIQAGVPVIATALPEIRKVVEGYGVGICLEPYAPETLAAALRRMREEPGLREGFLGNLPAAGAALCWEAEESAYLSLYR